MDSDTNSEMSEGSVGEHLEDANRRGREPCAKLIASSWVIRMALSRIESEDLEPWEVLLPAEERLLLQWTSSVTFMKMDGILEAYLETDMMPLKTYRRGGLRAPINHFHSANIREIEEAPEGCREADVAFFNDHFFRNYLPSFISNGRAMHQWLAYVMQPKVGVRATHAVARKISCPVKDGPELYEWLHDVFTALQAPRYSPNGEAADMLDAGIDHASMTIGDFVRIGETLYMVGLDGFFVLSLKESDQRVIRLEDHFVRYPELEQQKGPEEEPSHPSASSSSMPIEIDGPPTLFTREEQEEHEVVDPAYEAYHWQLYNAADSPTWVRPKDKRGLRKKLAEERLAFKEHRK